MGLVLLLQKQKLCSHSEKAQLEVFRETEQLDSFVGEVIDHLTAEKSHKCGYHKRGATFFCCVALLCLFAMRTLPLPPQIKSVEVMMLNFETT